MKDQRESVPRRTSPARGFAVAGALGILAIVLAWLLLGPMVAVLVAIAIIIIAGLVLTGGRDERSTE